MKAFFFRTLTGLEPADDEAKVSLRGLGQGEIVACNVSRPRNLKQMRLYWVLCHTIADAIGADASNISDVLKLKTGHFTTVQTKTETLKFPRSISFAKLDQPAFSAFFDKCCAVICAEWLPHMKAPELRKQIEDIVVGNHHGANPTPHVKAKHERAA